MYRKSAEKCISLILSNIDRRRTCDYADPNAVRRYNAAYKRIRDNANYLCDHYPEQMNLFIQLVDHQDYAIASPCTGVLFRLKSATIEQKRYAIVAAKRLLQRPEMSPMARLGWTWTIEGWEKEMSEHL